MHLFCIFDDKTEIPEKMANIIQLILLSFLITFLYVFGNPNASLNSENEFILSANVVNSVDNLPDPFHTNQESKKNTVTKFNLYLNLFLEGAIDVNTGLMRTSLRQKNLLPLSQPYNIAPYNYFGTESFSSTTEIPNKMVDWILIEIRQGTPSATGGAGTDLVERRAGILLEDGKVLSTDGTALAFDQLNVDAAYYILVRHRNHLDIISSQPIINSGSLIYSFSTDPNTAFPANQLKLVAGKYAMYAGDYQSDAVIQISDYDLWKNTPAVLNQYNFIDGNLDGTTQVNDFDLWKTNSSKVGPSEVMLQTIP